jgi:hypothetical protein
MEENSFSAKPVTMREPLRISSDEEPIRLVEPIDWKKNIDKVAPEGVTSPKPVLDKTPVKPVEEAKKPEVVTPVEAPKKAPEALKTPPKTVSAAPAAPKVSIPSKPSSTAPKSTSIAPVEAPQKSTQIAKPVVLEPMKTPKKTAAQKSTVWNFQLKKVDTNKSEQGEFTEVRSAKGEIEKPQSTRYMFTGSMMFLGATVLIIFPFFIPIVNAEFNPWWSLIFTVPVGIIVMIAGATMGSVGLIKSILDWFRKK